jgi:hypothetical protein
MVSQQCDALTWEMQVQNHYPATGGTINGFRVPPHAAGSPLSVEYLVPDIAGPTLPDAELHLQQFYQ